MKGIEAIYFAMQQRGWVIKDCFREAISYGRDGREGGWFIYFDDEHCSDEIYEELQILSKQPFEDGDILPGEIQAYTVKRAIELINLLPKATSN